MPNHFAAGGIHMAIQQQAMPLAREQQIWAMLRIIIQFS
jgi:hypothetical protein